MTSEDTRPESFLPQSAFTDVTVSPDRTRIAYFHESKGSVVLNVDRLDGQANQIGTDDDWPTRGQIVWAGNGRLFVARRSIGNPNTDIYRATLTGDIRPVITRDDRCLPLDGSPNGRWLLYGTQNQNGDWDLHVYDGQAEESTHLADVDGYRYHHQAGFCPDGDTLAYHAPTPRSGAKETDARCRLRSLPGGDERTLTVDDNSRRLRCLAWDTDCDRLLLRDDHHGEPRYGLYDLDEATVDWVETNVGVATVLHDGPRLIGSVADEMSQSVGTVDMQGSYRPLQLGTGIADVPGGVIGEPRLARGDVLVTHETPTQPRRLLRYDPERDTHAPIREPPLEADRERLVDPEFVAYEATDGTEIHGLLYDSGQRPSRGVVDVHGGPHAQVTREFSPRVQYLVACGFTVLQPNYRGSTGRGSEFTEAIRGDYGGVDVDDVAAGGRWLADREWIDADRIAAFGISHGGYIAYFQAIRHSDVWAACGALDGATDLVAMYEEYGNPHVLEDQLGGSPDDRPAFYRERSPITHASRVGCPVLMLHGEHDPAFDDVQRFRDALIESGNVSTDDIEFVKLSGQDHGPTTPEQRAEIADHLSRFLTDHM